MRMFVCVSAREREREPKAESYLLKGGISEIFSLEG